MDLVARDAHRQSKIDISSADVSGLEKNKQKSIHNVSSELLVKVVIFAKSQIFTIHRIHFFCLCNRMFSSLFPSREMTMACDLRSCKPAR